MRMIINVNIFFPINTTSFLIIYLPIPDHTKGTLNSNMALLWKSHKKVMMAIFGFAAYSLGVFYLGFRKGRKR